MHAPTIIAPAVMLPSWQVGALRLHKRAPIGMGEWTSRTVAEHYADECGADVAEEELQLEKRNSPPGSPARSKHARVKTVPAEIAVKKPTTSPEEIYQRTKEVEGFRNKKDLVGFEVSGHHPPCLLRRGLTLFHAGEEGV